MKGLFRVPVPNFDRRAFREAFVNALVHREYSRLGAVHIRIENEGMTISSPGGRGVPCKISWLPNPGPAILSWPILQRESAWRHPPKKTEQETRAVLEKLTEAGMVESYGTGRGRSYTLSFKVYKKTGQKAAYVRQAGVEPIQQEQMILSSIDKHGF